MYKCFPRTASSFPRICRIQSWLRFFLGPKAIPHIAVQSIGFAQEIFGHAKVFGSVGKGVAAAQAGGSSDTDSFMEELKELAKGDDRILFTGFVQGAMLDELYSNAYIYTLPSDLEGMPLSLLEAMSYGNCCLVSDIPECAEVVEDKALIFKKSDVEDLREKLQDACDHPEMVMRMKNQAADFICEKYNWDEVVKETMKLYRRK